MPFKFKEMLKISPLNHYPLGNQEPLHVYCTYIGNLVISHTYQNNHKMIIMYVCTHCTYVRTYNTTLYTCI